MVTRLVWRYEDGTLLGPIHLESGRLLLKHWRATAGATRGVEA